MYRNTITIGLILLLSAAAFGQVKASLITGEVVSIASNKLVLKAQNGSVDITLSDKTEYKRVVPAEKVSFANATPATFADIAAGDKVVASVLPADGGKWQPARTVYLMTKSDIAQRQTKESTEWKTRGIAGRITGIDADKKTMTVQMGGLMGSTSIALTPKEKAIFLHYAPDSVRFDEAKPSSFAEARVGDQLRAIGDKSADGAAFAAEKVLIGSFQTVAGTVKTVDAAKNEVVIKDLTTGKDVTVSTANITTFKRFPPEMAQRMAGFGAGGGVRPPGQGQGGQAGPPNGNGQGGGARPGGFGRGAGGGIDDMLDRFPTITTSDLKPGDMIAVASSKGAAPDRIKAFKLLAGVEPFIRMAQMASAGQNRGSQANLNITIPGLDGIGF
jgi:hypothetical protein